MKAKSIPDCSEGQSYTVTTMAGQYGNKWVVTRCSDGKIMTESHDPRKCHRWINMWGETDLGR